MSMNTAHIQGGGILIHAGECILLYSEHIGVEFIGRPEIPVGVKNGTLYLTTHRLVFINKNQQDKIQSFSFPFVALKDVDIEQPVFGANFIKGRIRAQPGGNWDGEAKFKLLFKKGGAIEFGQAMLKTVNMVGTYGPVPEIPPSYSAPTGPWYQAAPPAYTPPQSGYYGWVPPINVFPDVPPANSVFMTDMPPPYPGINGTGGYNTGYAHVNNSLPLGFNAPPQNQQNGTCTAVPAQNAYYDPNKPQCAYVPPPAYYESPPTYQNNGEKKNQ